MTFALGEVVPWGRSFDEYVDMFSLSQGDLESRILGCGDGPASFNAELTQANGQVVSCDPIYRFSVNEILSRIEDTVTTIGAELAENSDEFVWDRFGGVEDVIRTRLHSMERFLLDLPQGRLAGRYVDASLPALPFAEGEFDLAVCSHLLFLYSEQHDADFHVASLRELARVAAEVRVFPLLELGSKKSRHLTDVMNMVMAQGLSAEIVPVPYEFQKGGNEMLVVRRSGRKP